MKEDKRSLPGKIPVVITISDIVSGVTSWAYELQEAFKDYNKYELLLLSISFNIFESSDKFDINVPTIEAAYQVLREMSPVVVVPNFIWDLFPVCLDENIRSIGICHADSDEEYYNPLDWYEPLISQFIAVSSETADKLAQRIPTRAQDITTLPYGISVPETLQRTYQVAPIRLVYGGRVVQLQKRVLDFIPLVENLLKRRVDFVFDIVGEGTELARLRKAMLKIAPGGRVRFHGRVPPQAMPEIWLNHDIFVQVSDFEGTSVSLLEAMAQGTVPVVTAATSGIESVITHAANGFVVPVGDMEAMADRIAYLASKPDLLAAIGQAAYENARRFSIRSYAEKFSTVVDQALSSPAGTWPYKRCRIPRIAQLILEKQQVIESLSEEEISRHIPMRKMIIAMCFKIAAQPGFRWLRHFRGLGEKLLVR
jgi:glycosyltransferase involved in cell wall biosynthesis